VEARAPIGVSFPFPSGTGGSLGECIQAISSHMHGFEIRAFFHEESGILVFPCRGVTRPRTASSLSLDREVLFTGQSKFKVLDEDVEVLRVASDLSTDAHLTKHLTVTKVLGKFLCGEDRLFTSVDSEEYKEFMLGDYSLLVAKTYSYLENGNLELASKFIGILYVFDNKSDTENSPVGKSSESMSEAINMFLKVLQTGEVDERLKKHPMFTLFALVAEVGKQITELEEYGLNTGPFFKEINKSGQAKIPEATKKQGNVIPGVNSYQDSRNPGSAVLPCIRLGQLLLAKQSIDFLTNYVVDDEPNKQIVDILNKFLVKVKDKSRVDVDETISELSQVADPRKHAMLCGKLNIIKHAILKEDSVYVESDNELIAAESNVTAQIWGVNDLGSFEMEVQEKDYDNYVICRALELLQQHPELRGPSSFNEILSMAVRDTSKFVDTKMKSYLHDERPVLVKKYGDPFVLVYDSWADGNTSWTSSSKTIDHGRFNIRLTEESKSDLYRTLIAQVE